MCIRDRERVEPQQGAGRGDVPPHRDCRLVQLYAQLCALGKLAERRRNAAARGVAQDAHLRAVGEGASNVSLMDMSLQPEENTAFVRLVSWGGDAQVEVECYADGALCDVRAVSLTDGESQGVLLTVPEGTRSAMARVSPGGALAVDDTRWAVAPVSYTHLDVYKRQAQGWRRGNRGRRRQGGGEFRLF